MSIKPTNHITIMVSGKSIDYPLPAYGEVTLTVVDSQVRYVETKTKVKIE